MDTNFIILLIGVFFIMIIIKSMINFKHEEDKKNDRTVKEQVATPKPTVSQKSSETLKKHRECHAAQKGKVIYLDERRKIAACKKNKEYSKSNKNLHIRNEILKASSPKNEWWI
ncbi:MAG: hypothetical protein J6F30_16030 [Cellulosilyticum sp.]|nr:hypothetical protein [Cellulosilyticum sp.]